jgi:ketosteroid isomerase-like protein
MVETIRRAAMLLGTLAAVACSRAPSGPPATSGSDSLAVRAAYDERVAGLEAGDLERWLVAHAAGVRFVDPDAADIVGTDALRAWGQPFFTQFTMKVGETVEELEVDGTRAFIRYSFASEFLPKSGGTAIASRGKGLLLLRRQDDGHWKVTHNIWNSPTGLAK